MRLTNRLSVGLIGAAIFTIVGSAQSAAPGRRASGQDFTALGSFVNVRQTASDHCYGWSLQVWRYKGRLLGMLDRHAGLCGDPPCEVVSELSHAPTTGRLTFVAFGQRFSGILGPDEVTGNFGAEFLRLKRDDGRMNAAADKTFDAWCRFWRGVPRCKGVAETCDALSGGLQD